MFIRIRPVPGRTHITEIAFDRADLADFIEGSILELSSAQFPETY